MQTLAKDLWSLTSGKPQIDPVDLAAAVEDLACQDDLDYRSRLLIRDSIDALDQYWGVNRVNAWLSRAAAQDRIQAIRREEFDKVGFPTIRKRLMPKTDPAVIRQFLQEIGDHARSTNRLVLGGSVALILPGYLSRATEDLDVVDEVPREIREQHQLLDALEQRYGLLLAHFQSHYLPSGFANRLHYFDSFGSLSVYLVDVNDIFLGKLTSIRTKDIDDLRLLAPQLDRVVLVQRLKDTMESTFAAQSLKDRANKNWQLVFAEPLPY